MTDIQLKEHANRTSKLAKRFAKTIGLNRKDTDLFLNGCKVHDIGKMGLSEKILNKPTKLNNVEYTIVKFHSLIGCKLINIHNTRKELSLIVKHHHERIDGRGYPEGLEGEDIPLLSRAICIIDAFDAMTQDRPYRKGMPLQEALDELQRGRGTQFDSYLGYLFIDMIRLAK